MQHFAKNRRRIEEEHAEGPPEPRDSLSVALHGCVLQTKKQEHFNESH